MLLLFSLATGCLTPLRLAEGASDAASISPEPTSWVCRPGTDGVCGAQPKAEWAPDGSLTRGTFTPDPSAPIDCFYVYPTVDLRIRTANADLGDTGPADRVTRAQAALLGEVCRVWAPRYRQVTLGTYFVGERRATPYFEIAWSDISRAFDEFLAEIGPDRGFVLYGHSQGGQQVSRLLREKVEADPALRRRLVAAYPIGWRVATAPGERSGGSFRSVPTCAAEADTGCVVAFRSFAAGGPPTRPTDAYAEGATLACVNPARPGSSGHARLRGAVVLPTEEATTEAAGRGAAPMGYDPAADGLLVVPDAWQARCVPTPDGAALEVRWSPLPDDERPDLLELDHGRWGTPMGTHVLDVQLTLLDIVADVRRRAAAWARADG